MHFAAKKVLFNKAKTIQPKQDQVQAPQPLQPEIAIPNTNIISIDLGQLSKEVKIFTGDPTVCKSCDAIFNSSSKTQKGPEGMQWQCEFCDCINNVTLEEEEIPKGEEVFDYMLSPATESKTSSDEKIIIFCADISGSMCVTTEIQGEHKLRGDRKDEIAKSLNQNIIDQWMPGQRRDVTYVSRLQCVQAAIESQLDKLEKENPKSRVGLVVFNNEVTIFGDGSKEPVIITGDKLYQYNTLIQLGTEYQVTRPISESKSILVKRLFDITESGATALGPAIVVSVGMAHNFPGSKIVLATDGLANTGVGSMDTPEAIVQASTFYEQIAQYSKDKGIMVNVIGIKGESINMSIIGKLADITAAEVDIVDPVKIRENFASILESKIVATNVMVKLFLHKAFQSPEDEEWKRPLDKLFVARDIGNVHTDTEITVEFSQKSDIEISKIIDTITEKEKEEKHEFPFQVQVEYIALNGMKGLRVITRMKEITTDLSEVIKDVDVPLLGMHANVKASKFAQKGDVMNAISTAGTYAQLMEGNLKSKEDVQGYAAWSAVNNQVFASPSIVHQHQQQQQQQQQFNFGPPQPYQPYASFGSAQLPPLQQFNFGSLPQQSYAQLQPPQQQFNFGSGSLPQPQQYNNNNNNNNVSPSLYDIRSPQPNYDDSTSNSLFQQHNARKNKKQWTEKRKY